MKTNTNAIRILSLVATVVGVGATLLNDWVNEKKMEEMVEEKINEALTNQEEEES